VAVTPQPARDRARFALAVPEPGRYTVTVYDALGRQCWSGARAMQQGATLELEWDGRAEPAGSYFVVVRGPGRAWRTQLTLVR
jgi:hypothetical protein